jgi:hypothetical protein
MRLTPIEVPSHLGDEGVGSGAAPGGLHPDELRHIIALVGRLFQARAVTLCGMDPGQADREGRTVAAGLAALRAAVAAAATARA